MITRGFSSRTGLKCGLGPPGGGKKELNLGTEKAYDKVLADTNSVDLRRRTKWEETI
jgi:hypothetical protein